MLNLLMILIILMIEYLDSLNKSHFANYVIYETKLYNHIIGHEIKTIKSKY